MCHGGFFLHCWQQAKYTSEGGGGGRDGIFGCETWHCARMPSRSADGTMGNFFEGLRGSPLFSATSPGFPFCWGRANRAEGLMMFFFRPLLFSSFASTSGIGGCHDGAFIECILSSPFRSPGSYHPFSTSIRRKKKKKHRFEVQNHSISVDPAFLWDIYGRCGVLSQC